MMRKVFLVLLILFYIAANGYNQIPKRWNYPQITPDTAIDEYFEKKVIDPYRNLEDVENEQVQSWMRNQNAFYDSIIPNITFRDSINKVLKELAEKRKIATGYTRMVGNRIFYLTGLISDDNMKLVFIDRLNASPVELFDTKEFNTRDSCIYDFNYYEPSPNGKFIAFGISPNGNENATIHVLDVENRKLLSEKIERCFAANIQWTPDSKGFFYTQLKLLVTKEDKQDPLTGSKVLYHHLFTSPDHDKVVFSWEMNKDLGLDVRDSYKINVCPLSEYVLMNVLRKSYFIVFYAKLSDLFRLPADKVEWTKICDLKDKMCNNGVIGNRFFGLSNNPNPNGQLVAIDLPDTTQKIIWDAGDVGLADMIYNKKGIYITTLKNGLNNLVRVNPKNYQKDTIKLPFLGGIQLRPPVAVLSFFQPSENLIFSLTGYNKPYGDYICYQNKTVVNTNITPEIQFLPIEVIVEEIEIPSHDGTLVPLSIVYKKGTKMDGNNTLNMEAYGAYGYNQKPAFSRSRLVWFNNGGIYAFAHVRGGSEKGDGWYMGGFKATKSNSWRDLIACAEYLIEKKYTSPEKLAITGSSAGAVTIGRAITERPDLFKAAVINVGTFNPLRMENTSNKSTIKEFGTAKDSVEFQYLYNMDPYHHLKSGITYPSVLFTASLNDARVALWQPAKGVAKMQKISKGDNIVLFRIGNYGHSSYPSEADVYSFLFWQLGHPDFKLKANEGMFKPD
jgi:prolyl oligopeptidase